MKRLLLALLLTTACAVPAFAQMTGMEMKGAKQGHGQQMEMAAMDKMETMTGMCLQHSGMLGLSDDQLDSFTALHRAMEKKRLRSNAEVKIAEIDLMEIMAVKDFDLAKASAMVQKISDLKMALHLEMLKTMKDVRTTLTEEQFKKMKKMMSSMADGEKSKKMAKKHK